MYEHLIDTQEEAPQLLRLVTPVLSTPRQPYVLAVAQKQEDCAHNVRHIVCSTVQCNHLWYCCVHPQVSSGVWDVVLRLGATPSSRLFGVNESVNTLLMGYLWETWSYMQYPNTATAKVTFAKHDRGFDGRGSAVVLPQCTSPGKGEWKYVDVRYSKRVSQAQLCQQASIVRSSLLLAACRTPTYRNLPCVCCLFVQVYRVPTRHMRWTAGTTGTEQHRQCRATQNEPCLHPLHLSVSHL